MVLTAPPPRVCTRSASESIPLNTAPWQARSLEPLTSGAVRGQAWVWDTNVGDWRVTCAGPRWSECVPLSDAGSGRSGAVALLLPDFVPAAAGLLAAEGEDAGGAGLGPVHAGQFEALPDDSPCTRPRRRRSRPTCPGTGRAGSPSVGP